MWTRFRSGKLAGFCLLAGVTVVACMGSPAPVLAHSNDWAQPSMGGKDVGGFYPSAMTIAPFDVLADSFQGVGVLGDQIRS